MPIWFSEPFRERDPDTVHAFRSMLQACPADGYIGCCAALRDADLREAITRITAPVLAVAGTADTSTTPEHLVEAYTQLALQYPELNRVSSEAANLVVAEFIADHFDVEAVIGHLRALAGERAAEAAAEGEGAEVEVIALGEEDGEEDEEVVEGEPEEGEDDEREEDEDRKDDPGHGVSR
jgi:hypothetical protein